MLKARLVALLTATAVISGCGSNSSTTTSPETYNGTGSTWEITFDPSGSFSGTEKVSSATISGSWADLSTGFRQLTISSATGLGAPATGSNIWGIVVPGTVVILHPILSSETRPVALLRKGTCPTAAANYNWMSARIDADRNISGSDEEVYGDFSWNGSTKITVNTGYSLANNGTNLITTEESYTGNCGEGVITVTGGTIYLAASGSAMVAPNSGDAVFGIQKEQVSASVVAGKEMSGLIYKASGSSNSQRFLPVSATINSAGTGGTVTIKSSVETSATDSGTATLTLSSFNSPGNGLATGTITVGNNSGNLAAAVVADIASRGRTAIFAIGREPGNATKGYVVLLVSKSSSTASFRGIKKILYAGFDWLGSLLGISN